jgi:hypothetical protein
MREMEARPAAFGRVRRAGYIYRYLGSSQATEGLDWKGTGVREPERQDLWFQLFDSGDWDFSMPEFIHPRRSYWPELGDSWATCLDKARGWAYTSTVELPDRPVPDLSAAARWPTQERLEQACRSRVR